MVVVFGPQVCSTFPLCIWLFSAYAIGIWKWEDTPTSLFEETWLASVGLVVLKAVCVLSGGLLFGNMAWLVRGKIVPSEFEYWASFVDRWRISNKLINVCVKEQLLAPFFGTRWLNKVLRLVSNAQIDSSALVVDGGSFRDHDLVRIGPNAVVNCKTVFRTHTFEDWKLKFEYVTIHEEAAVGINAELMTGCTVEVGCDVDLNTIVNKGE